MNGRTLTCGLILFGLVGVVSATAGDLSLSAASPHSSAASENIGAVYTTSNDAADNAVLRFDRYADGTIEYSASYSTGGMGTGAGLGNQSGLVLANKWLLAVNAGSNDISVFRVRRGSLMLTDVEPSGGEQPISIAAFEGLVYVLNAAGAGNVTGFTLSDAGDLVAIPDSTRGLSGADPAGPAQVGFSADGRVLVVTQKPTSEIVTYLVGPDGLLSDPIVNTSSGQTPFGFAFTNSNVLIVSEAFGGAPDASAVSSYSIGMDGMLNVISASVPTTETAACWIAVPNSGRFAYTTNTGSGSVSAYEVDGEGVLMLRDGDGVTGVTGMDSAPIDMAFSRNSRYLYTLNSGNQTISVFEIIRRNGGLTPIQTVEDLPMGGNGLAAE